MLNGDLDSSMNLSTNAVNGSFSSYSKHDDYPKIPDSIQKEINRRQIGYFKNLLYKNTFDILILKNSLITC